MLILKELTEGRYLREQYDNKLRIERQKVYKAFMEKNLEDAIKIYLKWKNKLSEKNKDQNRRILC